MGIIDKCVLVIIVVAVTVAMYLTSGAVVLLTVVAHDRFEVVTVDTMVRVETHGI